MSIIERYSPLNLSYRVYIVTNASSPLGVVVCKNLLKSNGLVVGIDTKPRDPTLNAGLGCHFQFHHGDLAEDSAIDEIFKLSSEMFRKERIDGLINLTDIDDASNNVKVHEDLAAACAKIMREQAGGSIVNFSAKEGEKGLVPTTKTMAEQLGKKGVRVNGLVSKHSVGKEGSSKAFDAAKEHLNFLYTTKSTGTYDSDREEAPNNGAPFYEVANVSLFLSSDMSSEMNGLIFGADGSNVAA